VYGLLCESDQPATYYRQPHAFFDPERSDDRLPDPPYLVYLKVWERHITAVEDPAIRERALGDNGPDTAARSKVVWQVLASDRLPGGEPPVGPTLAEVRTQWAEWERNGRRGEPLLKARARPGSVDEDACVISPESRYRGLENQLYRVEVHTGGKVGEATFKWSRDNGAAIFPIESMAGRQLIVTSLGRDLGLGLEVDDWVEVVDDEVAVSTESQPLRQVVEINSLDRIVELDEAPSGGAGGRSDRHPFLRRWDQTERPANRGFPRINKADDENLGGDNALWLAESDKDWVELEVGVQILFQPGGEYRRGDYWLIPARTATGDVEWPQVVGGPAALPPMGVTYWCAPLAFVDSTSTSFDMRSVFKPISEHVV
jgi:hypothetical protein